MSTSAPQTTTAALRLVVWCCVATVLLASLPSLLNIGTLTPFVHPLVRRAAAQEIQWLRTHGFWLVNTTLVSVSSDQSSPCFTWKNAYRNRTRTDTSTLLHHCYEAH